jgi:6-phosphogluconolactonase
MLDGRDGNTDSEGRRLAYVGSFTSSGGRGITVAAVDPDTGALTRLTDVDAVADPSFLTLSADASTLYCVSETPDGAVAALALRNPDKPELLARVASRGAVPTHLSLAAGGKALLVANYGSGSVSVLPVLTGGGESGSGGIGAVADVVHHRGSGPVTGRQDGPHAHQVLPDPSGRWALAVDLGADTVYVHALDPAALRLRPHGSLRLRAGIGPRHLVFHPQGRVVYLVNELSPVLSVCRWDGAGGRLEEVDRVPIAAPGAEGPEYASNAVVSPDGRFVHAAVRGSDTLAVLAADESGEVLEPVTTVPCGGSWPRHLAADGSRLYVSNEHTGEVAWFDVDPETGVPAPAGTLPVPAASCVVLR